MRIWLSSAALLLAGGSLFGVGSAVAKTTKSIAHRGGSLFAPENTLAAFAACSNISSVVEFDVHESSDGNLVVIHDSTVNRTTDGIGSVNDLTLAQLKALDAGSWYSSLFAGETIPTLAEAVQCILPFATPCIERKTGPAQAYVDVLKANNASTNVLLLSFDWAFLADVRTLDPSIPLAPAGRGPLTSSMLSVIQAIGATAIAWQKSDISSTEVDMVRALGMDLVVWTANGPDVQTYVDMKVDGIISDDPALVRYLSDDRPSENHALGKELISYWKFDDGLFDLNNTNAYDVEIVTPGFLKGFDSAPSWISGTQAWLQGALQLDGINDCVDLTPSATLNINTNAVTISCWVLMPSRPSDIPESFGVIYDSDQDSYILYQDKAKGELRFKVTANNNDAARPGINQSDIITGQWHHVVGILNGNAGPVSGQASIYLDGRLMETSAFVR